MPILTQLGRGSSPQRKPHLHQDPTHEHTEEIAARRKAVAADLLEEHRAAAERLAIAGRHLVVAAWQAGLSETRIAGLLGCSRKPVSRILADARASGALDATTGE